MHKQVNKEWILRTLDYVKNGVTTISLASKVAEIDGYDSAVPISTKTFYNACKFNGISTNLKRGRNPYASYVEIQPIVSKLRSDGIIVGIRKMWRIVNNNPNNPRCGLSTIHDIYAGNGWLAPKKL